MINGLQDINIAYCKAKFFQLAKLLQRLGHGCYNIVSSNWNQPSPVLSSALDQDTTPVPDIKKHIETCRKKRADTMQRQDLEQRNETRIEKNLVYAENLPRAFKEADPDLDLEAVIDPLGRLPMPQSHPSLFCWRR